MDRKCLFFKIASKSIIAAAVRLCLSRLLRITRSSPSILPIVKHSHSFAKARGEIPLSNRALPRLIVFISLFVVCTVAQPLHWNYRPERLKELLDELEPSPEFRPESANPFYVRKTGEQSCYGDQAYVLLESLVECGGEASLPMLYEVCTCTAMLKE